jgi:hypothetical protein
MACCWLSFTAGAVLGGGVLGGGGAAVVGAGGGGGVLGGAAGAEVGIVGPVVVELLWLLQAVRLTPVIAAVVMPSAMSLRVVFMVIS